MTDWLSNKWRVKKEVKDWRSVFKEEKEVTDNKPDKRRVDRENEKSESEQENGGSDWLTFGKRRAKSQETAWHEKKNDCKEKADTDWVEGWYIKRMKDSEMGVLEMGWL